MAAFQNKIIIFGLIISLSLIGLPYFISEVSGYFPLDIRTMWPPFFGDSDVIFWPGPLTYSDFKEQEKREIFGKKNVAAYINTYWYWVVDLDRSSNPCTFTINSIEFRSFMSGDDS